MAILVDENTKVLIQGITGKEGSRACHEMLRYGTSVLAGVSPGKGGGEVEDVLVYNTVAEAVSKHPGINASLVVVPALRVRNAVEEALEAGIPLINILSEYVSARDSSLCVARARKIGARIIGPSSVGIISPGKGKIGSIGSGGVGNVFTSGSIGIISKSGGMTAELSSVLSRAGWGQSTVVGMGGDIIVGSDYVDMLELFEKDEATKAVVIFGEIGGTYEEDAADYVRMGKFTKPTIALIGGRFTNTLGVGVVLGHAGAIVSRGKGSYDSKVEALRGAGVVIAGAIEEIPSLLSGIVKEKS